MRIILTGMPGSGKSTIASRIARLKGLQFIDSDYYIEQKYNLTIEEIFRKFNENRFREFEYSALKEIIKNDNFILATGGGMPCYFDSINLMKNSGITIYLRASVQTLMHRIKADNITRPLLKDKTDKEIFKYLNDTLKIRELYYLQAEYIVDAGKTTDEIIKLPLFDY
ncbi:MAG: shikimate kinase [Bacteroidales bacterium]|nr:shikimate kinase [Bacteroidales bacterium]